MFFTGKRESEFQFIGIILSQEIFNLRDKRTNMFRPMRRFKQQISDEECKEVLTSEPRGVLSVLGDDGYPYGIPMDHWYSETDGKLYFHCSLPQVY